jgi:hypothetical protein
VLNAPGLIKEGQLQAAISVSHGTQNEVFMVPIDRAGNLNIDANSPVAKLFSTVDGHAQFNGGFVEIVRVENVDANGVPGVEVLSTVVGGNDVSIEVTDKITDHIFTPAYDIVPQQVEMPPVVFTESREQMGRTKVEYDQTPIVPEGYYGGYYGGERELTPEEIKERERETSPRLLDNPEARLVPGEEYDFYKKLLIEKRGQDYVAEIDKQVDQISELKAINNNTEAIITIPVNAAGKNEASSIYNILTKAYGGQDPDSLKKSVILLHLNWMDSYDNPDLARANIEKTKAEIERAKRDLGGKISIAVLETEFKRSDIKNSGVIGHVVRRMNDAAIMALDKAVDEGRMDTNHETLIIRNDADLIGMRKNYLKRYVDDFSDDNIADVYLGTTSFDQTNADRAPGLVLAGNIMQMASIISRDRENVVHTAGGNFGIRASSLAAIGGIGFGEYTGAGSDDVEVGRRMSMVRSGRIRVKNDGSYSALNQTEVNNRIGKTVHGARLDLNASRGEKEYINNRSVAGQWSDNKFDKDGYSDRDLGVDGSFSESLKDTPEDVLSRIENNIEGVININRPTLSTIRSTLAFTFPSSDCYVLKADNSGIYSFSLTSKGKKYLKNNLSGASTGKSYGQRKREWYGDNGKQSSMIRI